MGLTTLLPIVGFALLFARALRTTHAVALLHSVAGIVLVLYLGGLAGLLWWTALVIHLAGVGLLGHEIWRASRADVLPASPMPLVVLLAGTLLFAMVHGNSQFLFYDEYSHWGVFLREMLALDGFWPADTNSMHPRYPPAAPLWQYLFSVFVEPREGTAYIAQFVLLLTPLLVLWERLGFRQWPWALLILSLTVLTLANFSRGINSLYVDHVIAAWFVGTLLCFVLESPGPRRALVYAVPLTMLALIKEPSFAFSLAAAGILGLVYGFRSWQASARVIPAGARALLLSAAIVVPAWLGLAAWSWHLDRVGMPADVEAVGNIVSGLSSESEQVDRDLGAEITRRYLEVFATQQLAHDGISRQFNAFSYPLLDLYEEPYRLSTLGFFVAYLLWWAVLLGIVLRGTARVVWGIVASGIFLTGAAFVFALYLTWRYASGEYGLVMSSYMRYVQTIALPMLIASFAPLFPVFGGDGSRRRFVLKGRPVRFASVLAVAGCAALWVFETPYLRAVREPNPELTLRQQLEPVATAIHAMAGTEPVWVYLPNDRPNRFIGQLLQYLLAPTPAQIERDPAFLDAAPGHVFDVWSDFGYVWLAGELEPETQARFSEISGMQEDQRLFAVRADKPGGTLLEPAEGSR